MCIETLRNWLCSTDPDYTHLKKERDQCLKSYDITSTALLKATKELKKCSEDLAGCADKIELFKNEILTREEKIIELEDLLANIPPEKAIPPKVRAWDEKYPFVNIYYLGRTIPGLPEGAPKVKEDVRHFINQHDGRTYGFINNRSLQITDPWSCNEQITEIYKKDREGFQYAYDSNQFGISELWLYPAELMTLGKGDCEDWANLLASRLLCAGLPSERLRVVAGMVNNNAGGHCTVYVLGDDQETWYHLNSTGGYRGNDLTQYPTSKDQTDPLGVIGENIWFAYHDKKSFHEFRTTEAKNSFNQDKKMKNIVIERRAP